MAILIDTSVWVDWSNDKTLPQSIELARLLEIDEVATTDVVMAEVLQGARTQAVFDDWATRLDAFHYFPVTQDSWLSAARLSFRLMRQGLTTALSDLLVAQVALENNLAIFTTDSDFQRFPDLRLHQ